MEQDTPIPTTEPNVIDRSFRYLESLATSDRLLMKLSIVALFVSGLWLVVSLSDFGRVEIASSGGSYTEGIVGTPRFVNPVLAVTRADRDLAALLYDGLMILGHEGKLVPNIAESVTVSDDGLTYNIVLRKDVGFHDGTSLTARDVAFTVARIQDPEIASPLRAGFEGVSLEQLGDYELNFVLKEPYTPFLENLTFGILPEHLWKDASNEEFPFSQLNSEPIGAGPYMVSKIIRTPSGIPESYVLKPNTRYHNGTPKIETFTLKFFPNDEQNVAAFNRGEIDAIVGIDQSRLTELSLNTEKNSIIHIPLPRTFAIFMNQNKSAALRDAAARKALSASIDRERLVSDVLGGYGTPLDGPIPSSFVDASDDETEEVATEEEQGPTEIARGILRNGGWKYNEDEGVWEKTIDGSLTPLSFSISTMNTPAFESTVEFLEARWEELGIPVTIKRFEQSDLTQSVIRPRDYEALFFGTQLGRPLDFFPFWHSSQRNDPGLNISLYANISADAALTEERTSPDPAQQAEALSSFETEIHKDNPAIFLYAPELIYVFPQRVIGATFKRIAEPQERFSSVHEWYINTESVWPIFKDEEE